MLAQGAVPVTFSRSAATEERKEEEGPSSEKNKRNGIGKLYFFN